MGIGFVQRVPLVTTNRPFAEWSEVFPNTGVIAGMQIRYVSVNRL